MVNIWTFGHQKKSRLLNLGFEDQSYHDQMFNNVLHDKLYDGFA